MKARCAEVVCAVSMAEYRKICRIRELCGESQPEGKPFRSFLGPSGKKLVTSRDFCRDSRAATGFEAEHAWSRRIRRYRSHVIGVAERETPAFSQKAETVESTARTFTTVPDGKSNEWALAWR
jgi:hypothetical protein